MKVKYVTDIIKEIQARGSIQVPGGYITGEAFEEWLREGKEDFEMSISEQVKKLRNLVKEYKNPPYGREVAGTAEALSEAADTIESLSAKLAAENMENGGGWIAISERLPTKEESIKNDNRFILDDGNRRYEGCFDYIEKRFVRFNCNGMQTDKCVIAWREMPEKYRP